MITNNISYTQDGAEKLIARFLQISFERLEFVTCFGSGESFEKPNKQIDDITSIKKGLFSEFDDLWKELANR